MKRSESRNAVFLPYLMSPSPDPMNIVWSGDWAVAHHLWATLVELRADGSPAPNLAASWVRSVDELTWTFVLKEGLKWSDGSSMHPEQILQSLQASRKGTSHSDLSATIKEIKVEQGKILFHLHRPLPTFLVSLSYIDWAIVHPDTLDLSGERPRVKKAFPASGHFILKSALDSKEAVQSQDFRLNPYFQRENSLKLEEGRLSYFKSCQELVDQAPSILVFRSFAEGLKPDCRKKLEAEFHIRELNPTWVISAQFTRGAEKRLAKDQRLWTWLELLKLLGDQPGFGMQRATGLLAPHLFGALDESEFDALRSELAKQVTKVNANSVKGMKLKLVTMDLWSEWKSYAWLFESLKKLGFEVESHVLSRGEYFRVFDDPEFEASFDLNFIPTGVGDPDPDGTWQTAARNFFPGWVNKAKVKEAFFENDPRKRAVIYKELARELLSLGVFLPFRLDAPVLGVHKSLRLGDVAPFRAGLTLYDLQKKDQ